MAQLQCAPQRQALKRHNALWLRSTTRREFGSAIAALFSRTLSVRETVSIVKPEIVGDILRDLGVRSRHCI